MRYCAYCGSQIEPDKSYYKYLDNFLQTKYFEDVDENDNCFCCPDCAGRALFLTEICPERGEESDEHI